MLYRVTLGAMRFESKEIEIEAASPADACQKAKAAEERADDDYLPGDAGEPWIEALAVDDAPVKVPAEFSDPKGPHEDDAAYIEKARTTYASDDIEIDATAKVSVMRNEETDGARPLGAWVAAWVWVPDGEAKP